MERHSKSGKERRQVRAALHAERPAIQVGKNGVDAPMLAALEEAIASREALKIRVGNNCPTGPVETAEQLADALHAEIIGVTGRTVLLWRPQDEG
jgi:RNA-binding protein